MNMNKKDLKRLSKSQLIKLPIKQEKNKQANEFENSVVPQPIFNCTECVLKIPKDFILPVSDAYSQLIFNAPSFNPKH